MPDPERAPTPESPDPKALLTLSGRIVVLRQGLFAQIGARRAIRLHPTASQVATVIGETNPFDIDTPTAAPTMAFRVANPRRSLHRPPWRRRPWSLADLRRVCCPDPGT